jgi:hypothetical protein
LLRLVTLKELGILSQPECRRLAQIFWNPVASTEGLPFDTWGPSTAYVALALPGAPAIAPLQRVKNHIMSNEPGDAHWGVVDPGSYFEIILHANRQKYISWTTNDADNLFASIRRWWDTRGSVLATQMRGSRFRRAFDEGALLRFVDLLWEAMRCVVIPHLPRRQERTAGVNSLVDEMQTAGLPVGSVLPATLLMDPGLSTGVVARLRQEFASPKKEFNLSAARGVVYWVDVNTKRARNAKDRLPDVPVQLLQEIGVAVAWGRPDSLSLYLDFAWNVVRRLRTNTDSTFAHQLLMALEALLQETEYREIKEAGARIQYENVPTVRFGAARLAMTLGEIGYGDYAVIQDWKRAASNDPLPEIRRLLAPWRAELEE